MPQQPNGPGGGVTFVTNGPVTDEARAHAEASMERLIAIAPRPVLFARVKLTVEPQRAPEEHARAQGTLDVSGSLIRAEAAAANTIEATNLLVDRLDRRMRRLRERREDARDRPPSSPSGEWRHGDLPDSRPGFYPRPPEDRRLVRHKTFAPLRISIEEAVLDLEALHYRFFLFTDQTDGTDSIVYEADEAVRLRRLTGGDAPVDRPIPVEIDPTPAPALTDHRAIDHLNLTDEPFVFYRDAAGRGKVLYRRYDGHYGLIEPR